MSARVVHVKDEVPDAVYIGRANNRMRLKASPFANPFMVKDYGRHGAIAMYRDWLFHGVSGVIVLASLPELRDKPLACWCRHDGVPGSITDRCHGDLLVDLLNSYSDEEIAKIAAQPGVAFGDRLKS